MSVNAMAQAAQSGPYRVMTDDGTKPEGECQQLGEGWVLFAGQGRTDESGSWMLNLRDAACPNTLYIIDSVSLVATPTYEPYVKMIQYPSFISTGTFGNLELHVRTWDYKGEPQGGVDFSWHAAIVHHLE